MKKKFCPKLAAEYGIKKAQSLPKDIAKKIIFSRGLQKSSL
jgi:hypothetical protein